MMTVKIKLKDLLLIKLCFLVSFISLGQSNEVGTLQLQFKDYADKTLQEKLFVHTDKSSYLAGETMWFKIYSIDGNKHTLLDVSKVVYLEILDKESVPVMQTKVSMADGNGNGSLILPTSVNSGNYTVRAYTNWMKNFSSEYFFEKPLVIVNTFKPLGLENFAHVSSHDLQFFPEGGHLVTNVQSKVAFKGIDKNGKGVNLKGVILNQKNDIVAHITTHKFGMGHFFITPEPGAQYRAMLTDDKGITVTQYLPAAQLSGVVIQLNDEKDDHLRLTISTNESVASFSAPVIYLLVHTRNDVKLLEEARIGSDGKVVFLIEKRKLGEGVSHFTVFNSSRQPMAERLYFKRPSPDKVLDIKTVSSQKQYAKRAQVDLNFTTQSKVGQSEPADMSVAIFRIDSLTKIQQQDFTSFLWLTSDLRGAIESPEYYLGTGKEIDVAIDDLMLTHGWRRFSWEKILSKDKPAFKYIPEFKGHFVQGKVLDAANGQPARNIDAYLASPSQTVNLYASKSDRDGNILFDVKNFYGSRDLIVQADSRAMNTYRFEIESPFSGQGSSIKLPSFDLTRTLEKQLETSSIHLQVQNYHLPASFFQGVIPAHNSEPFYGSADRVFMLDDYTRFPVMEEVMREYVQPVMVRKRGGKFHFMVIDIPRKAPFDGNPLVLLDGVPVFDIDKIMAYDPRKVKRLDVVSRKYYLGPLTFNGIVSYTTYNGDMKDFVLDEKVLLTEYEGLQLKREFYSPKYTVDQTASALPDLRTVLNWTPNLKTGKDGKQQLSFFSSDQAGKYVVVVYGVSGTGKVGNSTYTFDVVDQAL